MKSNFGRHIVLWMLLAFVFGILVVPVFMGPEQVDEVIMREYSNHEYYLGDDYREIRRASIESFRRLFVDPGYVSSSIRFFSGDPSAGVMTTEQAVTSTSANWIFSAWRIVFLAIYRFNLALFWLLPAFAVLVAAAIDGTVERKLKKQEFGVSDPIHFGYAAHALILILGSSVALFFAPISIPALVWPVYILIFSMALWYFMANFQAGVSGMS